VQAQDFILAPIVRGKEHEPHPPLPVRIISRVPWLQRRLAALVGLGVRPEHVHSPRVAV
jgi:hypothetical protein